MDRLLCGALLAGLLLSVGLFTVEAQKLEEGNLSANYTPCGGNASDNVILLNPSLNVSTCNITVYAPAGSNYTSILFSRIDLHGTDNMTIYDNSDRLMNVTGSRDSLVVVVNSLKAVLSVRINANNSGSVLQATYNTSGCLIHQTVSGSSMVQSPVYVPNKGAFNCSYVVDQAPSTNTRLALSFLDVALTNATLNITSAGVVVNGTRNLPPDVYGSKIQMLLTVPKFKGAMQNFSAAVSPVLSSSVCGQVKVVTGNFSLNLTVPASHPLPYDCRVTLKAARGKSLWMNITSMRLAAHGDSLEIVDGGSLAGNNTLASFTSAKSGYLVLSGQKQVLVRLVVGLMMGQRSLLADVKELNMVQHLYNTGNLSIPRSPGKAVVSQYFLIESQTNASVKLMFPQEKMNATFSVSVYDGDQPSSPLLVTFSSNQQLGVPVVSSGSRLLLEARLANNSTPLNASFSSQAPGCDKITSAHEGMFQLMTSPQVPPMCRWTVTAPPNSNGTILLDMAMVKLSKNATVSVYSGSAGMGGSLVARFTNASSLSSAPLPAVAVPASQWAQVVWSSGNSSNLTSVAVNVRFQLLDSLCGGQVQAAQGHFRSPAFPNLYPLNALCQWTFPPSKPGRLLFFDIPQFQLAQNHSLVIAEKVNGTSRQVASFSSSSAPLPDVLYASNVTNTVTFSARLPKTVAVPNQVAQGFDVKYWALNCGGFMNQSNGSFSSPGYPAQIPIAPANATLCVWFVNLTRKAGEDPKVVNMTLQFKKTGSANVTELVKVYDGNTIRQTPIALNVSKQMSAMALSRYTAVIIVFNISALSSKGVKADSPKLAFLLSYTTFDCNKTYQCKNGLCMHPDWRCNGKDDCGDSSDEQHCIVPIPPPQSNKKGMEPAIVVLLFFVGLVLGILLTLIVPRIIRRFRTNRYASFRNEPAVA